MLPITSIGWLDQGFGALSVLNALIIACLVCWGVWGVFDKKALERAPEMDVFLVMLLLELPQILIIYFLLNHFQPGWHIAPELWFWGGIGALTYGISMVTYLAALSRTEASYVLGFTASYPLVGQALSVLFLGEEVLFYRVLGGILIALGVFIIGVSGNGKALGGSDGAGPNADGALPAAESADAHAAGTKKATRLQRLFVPLCVLAATLSWGGKGVIDKFAVTYGDPLEVYFVEILLNSLYLVPVIAYFILKKAKPVLNSGKVWFYTALSAVALAVGAWSYFGALKLASVSYVITITGCYPLLMYAFTIYLLKERLNKARLLGILLVVLGGLAVQLTQG